MHSLVDPSVELEKLHAGAKIALSIPRWLRYKRLLMNILTFTTLFPSGNRPNFYIFVFQRMSHVAERSGNTVVVIAPVPFFPSWISSKRWGIFGQIPRQERLGNLEVYHPQYPIVPGVLMPLHGLLMFLGSFPLARRLHRQFRFDCIDAHYVYPDGFAAVLLGKLLKLPVVVSVRGTDINVFPSLPMIRPMLLWTLRNASGIICVSSALRSNVINLGLSAKAVCVIPNGVDLERFHPMSQPEARQLLGLPKEGKIAVSVGSLTEGKNHSLLISAFARVSEVRPESRLYILGEGPRRAALLALIRTLDLTEKVFLVGPKPNEELALWFNAADVSCLASSREGWPNVLMESIACGTPVVATRVGGVPEIIVSSELGLLVEQDQAALANGLQSALERDWDRTALARHAQARGWDRVAAEVEQYFRARLVRSSR